MDRELLKKAIKTSKQPQLLETVINAQLHTAYRVVVYRMNTKGIKVKIPGILHEMEMDYLLSIDPSNSDYVAVTDAIANDNGSSVFIGILDQLYARLKEYLDLSEKDGTNKLKRIYKRGGLVNEYDITALVSNVTTNLDIEGINTCNLSCVDASLASFRTEEMQRLYAQNPWLQVAQNGILDFYERKLPELKAFKFREFDLVRVSTYSSLTQSLPEKIEEIKKVLGVYSNSDAVSLLTEYCMLPSFTGFVQSIDNSTTVGSVSQVNVACTGVVRVLSQTSTVVDQALANSVVLKHRELLKDTSNNKAPIAPTANIFSGGSSLDVFAKLINGNLYPSIKPVDGDPVYGKPSLSNLYDLAKKDPQGKALTIANVIPLFPSLVALHYLKERFSELIFYCDDAMEPEQKMMKPNSPGIPIKATKAELLDSLRPYMYMLKNNFELFDSEYQSPYEVLSTIRGAAYMEIFEDRTGMFRLRFPKYNNARIDVPLGPHVITSINMNRSDSNTFSIVRTRFMGDLIGAMRQVIPEVFIDSLSMLRYGFRMTAPIENPNAISKTFSQKLAPFIKYYSVLRESRTATISVIGNSKTELGQMASFRYGYKSDIEDIKAGYQNAGVSAYANGHSYEYSTGDYVGYVTNISETIGIDQVFIQNLTLKFVRDAQITLSKRDTDNPTTIFTSPAGNLAMGTQQIQSKILPLLAKLFIPGGSRTFTIPVLSTPDAFPMISSYTKDAFFAAFAYIPDSLELAKHYLSNKKKCDEEAKQAKALAGGNPTTAPTDKDIQDTVKGIDDKYQYLGILKHQSTLLYIVGTKIQSEFYNGGNKYAGSSWAIIKNKLSDIINQSYGELKTKHYPTGRVPVTVQGVLPEFKAVYGQKNVPVSKNDYDLSVDQLLFAAQWIHNKISGVYSFEKDITKVLAVPRRGTIMNALHFWDGNVQWNDIWFAFLTALAAQCKSYNDQDIPNEEKTIVKLVENLKQYEDDQKKASEAKPGVAA